MADQKNMRDNGAFFAQVRGRVQGVGFRYSAYHEASRLGLTGWVRNTYDGEVEVWAEGPQESLDTLIQWLYQGPPRARVDEVDAETKSPTGAYRVFSIE
ncbi:acylphosphatase [Treponema primitia ZAS-2]|uniref:Acylphosphatase n=1 Tax=Treponema primitia (strain ATCC BAA-887 / DSM 12427 / ZAS-2) TaxID=545694 RepID=F5YJF3_TREPZ|nr:acylphosphatase [Treponema primitia]AEF84333.1 acylphosphatase [Treponema primitia ZAS-2]